jgi:hypothetical protein
MKWRFRSIRNRATLVATLLALCACADGGSGPGPGVAQAAPALPAAIAGSCNIAATGNCTEWVGASFKQLTMGRLCASQKGVFSEGVACPVEGRVGTCRRWAGTPSESRFTYYVSFPGYGVKMTPAAIAKDAQDQCVRLMKGQWSSKP